ncbi:MAG: hypothetical protein ACE14L_18050 [Terriglobales bacterium]
MEIALGLLALLTQGALLWAVLLLRKHGLAQLLYLMAGRIRALADAVAIAQEQHRRSVAEYTSAAKTAAQVIQETL